MAADPYKVLGVDKSATPEAIQKAYRQLAKKMHPDLNPGNKQAEEQFKEVSAAYGLLSDPEKRRRFDAGEIDASGAETPRQNYYRDYAGAGAGNPYARQADFDVDEDFLSELFGRQARQGRRDFRMKGQDARYHLVLDFLDAVNGGSQKVTMPDGAQLDVNIPPGTRDGQILRLRGKGMPGMGGGPPGDALVDIEIRPHKFFRREGDDIRLDLPVTLKEAVLGAKVNVPTISGRVSMGIPKGSNTGSTLRLKGQGVKKADGTRGDQYVTLQVMLPERPDPELEKFVNEWQPAASRDPREAMGG